MADPKRITTPGADSDDEAVNLIVPISYTGYGVHKYPDERIEGWQLGRFEYGGSNEDCFAECVLWTPPQLNPWQIVELLRKYQK